MRTSLGVPYHYVIAVNGGTKPPDNIGEIVVRGDIAMKGYWRNPAATAKTLSSGWLHTGDLGYKDIEDLLPPR